MAEATISVLELSPEERELLGELLRRELEDLPAEIHHTDSSEYRAALRRKRALAQALFDKLEGLKPVV